MPENLYTNFQYSRIQNKILSTSGGTPSIFSGSTSALTETDQMVLGNFQTTDILNGEIAINETDKKIFYRAGDSIIEIQTGSTAVTALSGLTDVDVSGVTNGQVIVYNSTTNLWESADYSATLSGLTDVNVTGVTDGQMMIWNSGTTQWENADYNGIPNEVVDTDLDSIKVLEQAPVNTFYSDAELLVSEQDLTTSYADFGSEIDMEGYNKLGLYIDLDVNDSTSIYLKLVGLDDFSGTEYDIHNLSPINLTEADGSYYYEFDVETVRIVKIQAYAGTVGATAGDLTINFNKKYVTSSNDTNDLLYELNDITREPTGIQSNTDRYNSDITVTYDSTGRTITLGGDFVAYYRGELVPELTSGWVSPAHLTGVTENTFLQYNGSDFEWTTTFDVSQLFIAFIIANSTGVLWAQRECHGLIPWQTHSNLHNTIGTWRYSGGDLTNYTLNSTTTADRRPDTSECIVVDEDFRTNITEHIATGETYTIGYITGATGDVVLETAQDDIVRLSGNQPYYNQWDGSQWVQTLVTNNRYMAMYQVAIPTTTDDYSKPYRLVWVQGQVSGSLSVVNGESPNSLNFGAFAEISPEFVFINKVIVRYTGGNWRLYSVESIQGTRGGQVTISGGYLSTVATEPEYFSGNGSPSSPITYLGGSVLKEKYIFSSALQTFNIPSGTTGSNLESVVWAGANQQYATISFTPEYTTIYKVEMDTFLDSKGYNTWVGLHSASGATNTPDYGWYQLRQDGQIFNGYVKPYFLVPLTAGTSYNFYFQAISDDSGDAFLVSTQKATSFDVIDIPTYTKLTVSRTANDFESVEITTA